MRPTRRMALAAALTTALSICLAAGVPATGADDHAERLTGMVCAVDARGSTFDLLTGVGHALRVTHIHMPPIARLEAQGRETAFSRLTPGSIVRVECRVTPTGTVASTAELLEVAPGPRKP